MSSCWTCPTTRRLTSSRPTRRSARSAIEPDTSKRPSSDTRRVSSRQAVRAAAYALLATALALALVLDVAAVPAPHPDPPQPHHGNARALAHAAPARPVAPDAGRLRQRDRPARRRVGGVPLVQPEYNNWILDPRSGRVKDRLYSLADQIVGAVPKEQIQRVLGRVVS